MLKELFNCSLGDHKSKDFCQYTLYQIGRDLLLIISGGESHIGSLAFTDKKSDIKQRSFSLEGHKEEKLANSALNKLKQVTTGELTVIGGIHYDNLNLKQINKIVKNCDELEEKIFNYLANKSN